jgi:acetyl esterase
MPLDPLAKRFLDMLATASQRNMREETVAQRRVAYDSLMRFSDTRPVACEVEDHSMVGPGGPLKLRLYAPTISVMRRSPALVYFHGGGLVAGSLNGYDALCKTLAHGIGCRVVSVDYRLAPEHKFPAAVMDCYAALRWVAETEVELGVNRERIAVGGDSAGATLAAVVCQMAKQAGGPKITLQLLLCPVLDCDQTTPSRRAFAEGYLVDQATMERDLAEYRPDGVDASDPRLAPLRALDLRGLPPAHIHTAEFDPLRDEGADYAEKLARAGVSVDHRCHAGMIHHFYALGSIIPNARIALKKITSGAKAALRLQRTTGEALSP